MPKPEAPEAKGSPRLAALDEPPLRFAAGADAVETFETKARTLQEQAHAHLGLSTSLSHEIG